VTEFIYEVTDVPVSEGVTPWQTVGPFFHYALPYDDGPLVAGESRDMIRVGNFLIGRNTAS